LFHVHGDRDVPPLLSSGTVWSLTPVDVGPFFEQLVTRVPVPLALGPVLERSEARNLPLRRSVADLAE